ncbi:pentapeptide repeat-containing protein [Nonomuraea sp. NPDC049649]|uniref:pentapeptide repeat-containing protein n=1 Tax=Nonomuraea sp. NPDC049649 TaxID=3155776 RepID=UPI0034287D3D
MCEADRPLPKEANGEELVRGRARMVTEDTTIGPGDWDDRDLDGEVFRRVHFVDLDLMELADHGAVFEECSFGNVRFNVSVHENAAFVACSFRSCSFFDASFTGCKLTGSTFAGCTFGLLKADGGDWSFTSLAGADLRGSTFDGVRLREADLSGANLEGAALRRCDLTGAALRQTDLTSCDLRGSDLSTLDPHAVTLRKAVVDPHQATVIVTALGLQVRP